MLIKSITAIAPVNIATIKYWGKRDEKLILPWNDSVSVTLSTDQMRATTTVAISPEFMEDVIWLNSKQEAISSRLQNLLEIMRKLSKEKKDSNEHEWKIRICSVNNFPTAAGLASSSAGYACLVFALAKLYELDIELSTLARQGSGSACRSMYGGFVRWNAGTLKDGSDSIATPIVGSEYWPEMRALILVVNDHRKKIGSTSGMQLTVETSSLIQHRFRTSAPANIVKMIEAIKNKDFQTFAEVTMRDSNQFHAVCRDTYPPLLYLNDASNTIISFVHMFNDFYGVNKVAYSFDAGPNACLFLLEEMVPLLIKTIMRAFSMHGTPHLLLQNKEKLNIDHVKTEDLPQIFIKTEPNMIQYMYLTKVGEGPQLLGDEASLFNDQGCPRNV